VTPEWFEYGEEHQYERLRVNAEVIVSVPGSLIDSGRAPSIGVACGMERLTAREMERYNEWNLPRRKYA
jgi:hypothetical protein